MASEPWPEDLNNASSPMFQQFCDIMGPGLAYIYESSGLYSQVTVNITGFRHGSFISDYVVALRSLTSLTADQIKAKVQEKVAELASASVKSALPAGLRNSAIKGVQVNNIVTVSQPPTTKAPSRSNVAQPNVNEQSKSSAILVCYSIKLYLFQLVLLVLF